MNYLYGPAGASWDFNGGTGIAGNGSAFNNANAPDGVQVAFIQGGAVSYFQQTVTGLIPGANYFFTFQSAQRNPPQGAAYYGDQDFEVLFDGTVIGSYFPGSTSFQPFLTGLATATSSSGVLMFRGIDTLGGDRTAFVDLIEGHEAVPEPGSVLLLLSGAGVILGLKRYRG